MLSKIAENWPKIVVFEPFPAKKREKILKDIICAENAQVGVIELTSKALKKV